MTRLISTVCPFCGHEYELSSAVVEKKFAPAVEPRMKPGDVTMCIGCGEICLMGDDHMLRKPTAKEAGQLNRNVMVQKLREAWRDSVGKRMSS